MINIASYPQTITPAFNPIEFLISSNEQTRIDFRFIIRVKDAAGNLLAQKKIVGGGTSGNYVRTNVSKPLAILQKFDAWNLAPPGGDLIYSPAMEGYTFVNPYTVEIAEYYSGAEHDLKVTNDLRTIPAALSTIAFKFYSFAAASQTGRWLTNLKSFNVRSFDSLTLCYLNPSAAATGFLFTYFDVDNVPFANVTLQSPGDGDDVVFVCAGLPLSGLSASDVDRTDYYTIEPLGTPQAAPVMMVKVVPEDLRFTGARLHYLNVWGAVDSFLFNLASKRTLNVEKKAGKFVSDNSELRPAGYGINSAPYVVQNTDALKLSSEYITDNESVALTELITSPIVLAEVPAALFIPANPGDLLRLPAEVTPTTFEVKQSNVDKLFNADVEIKISIDNARQTI